MKNTAKIPDIFRHGARWIRADFHLHTRADDEFIYTGDSNFFAEAYFEQLEREDIRVAVVTNHNKFDLAEFRELRTWAERKAIYLLPGVELSVKDGAKGLHILIVFEDSWIYNPENKNFIQDFISAVFAGKSGYDRAPYDQNTTTTFRETCRQLDGFGKDYFVVMAHVDDSSGLFSELKGRGLSEFLAADCFTERVLACQKSRNRDNGKALPTIALVEGSDSAHEGIAGIGHGNTVGGITRKTYLKLSDFNFTALKFALRSHQERLCTTLSNAERLWVKKLTINPDSEQAVEIPLNAGLNTLIGVRGGGKSSVLEALRFVLELPLPDDGSRREDRAYKENIVSRLLGNGGKARLEIANAEGKVCYFVERSADGRRAEVYDGGKNPLADQRPAQVIRTAYFGQKDLEYAGQRFDGLFIEEKLLQNELEPLKAKTRAAAEQVRSTLVRLGGLREDMSILETVNEEIQRLTRLQNNYQQHDLKARLELITQYDEEEDFLTEVREALGRYKNELGSRLEEAVAELDQWLRHIPKVEKELFQARILPAIQQVREMFGQWKNSCVAPEGNDRDPGHIFSEAVAIFDRQKVTKQEEFEALKRKINDPGINVESFREVERKLRANLQKQQILEKKQEQFEQLGKALDTQLTHLKSCWEAEFDVVKKALEEFNAHSESIKINANFMGDRPAFAEQLQTWLRGSNLRTTHYEEITKQYACGIDLYRDLSNEASPLHQTLRGGALLPNLQDRLVKVMDELLLWRTPDRFEFLYKGRPLSAYSLGQRATALTAFILAHQQKDLFIIDQPEDDLDNQTVARELIRQVIETKQHTQYVFATHNPNIVVLGDSDQVIECQFSQDKFNVDLAAGIDHKDVQTVIINIMEGGEEALKTRTRFYQIANSWKH